MSTEAPSQNIVTRQRPIPEILIGWNEKYPDQNMVSIAYRKMQRGHKIGKFLNLSPLAWVSVCLALVYSHISENQSLYIINTYYKLGNQGSHRPVISTQRITYPLTPWFWAEELKGLTKELSYNKIATTHTQRQGRSCELHCWNAVLETIFAYQLCSDGSSRTYTEQFGFSW